jgi:DNA-directed RNA polymerase specialized sigma24 family protein
MIDGSWSSVLDDLRAWHADGDRRAGQRAVEAVERELRRRVPAAAKRRWPPEQVEDALQGFLMRLVRLPLPASIVDPRAYLIRAFRNACIDVERGRKRHAAEPWDEDHGAAAPTDDSAERIEAALATLSLDDRLALKMTTAPDLLSHEELDALARRAGLSVHEVAERVRACPPIHELTLLFDPAERPGEDRRDRMERFRKRRERARKRLRDALRGEA